MVLRRSESTKTTFSIYVTRKTKYQRWLGIINVLMLLGSLTMLFMGLDLALRYYMDQLDFVSVNFQILPWLLVSLGIATFILSALGFIFSSSEERSLVLIYAWLTLIISLVQIVSIFIAMFVWSRIESGAVSSQPGSALKNYETDPDVRAKWDYLHLKLRCCGAYGYTAFTNQPSSHYSCVPATCCWDFAKYRSLESASFNSVSTTSCTSDLVTESGSCKQESILARKIYVRGCLDILDEKYREDIPGLMLTYGIGGTVFALIELTGIALAFAYSAQMSRRAKREREWQPGEDMAANQNVVPMDNLDM